MRQLIDYLIKMIRKPKVKELIIDIILAVVYIAALTISSGLTRIVMAVLLIATFVCLFLSDSIKHIFIIIITGLFLILSLYADLQGVSDLQFYQTTNQSIYQPEFYAQQINPDAYIRELIRDKTVIVPYEVKLYSAYDTKKEEDRNESFSNRYFRETNYVRYFKEYARSCEVDEELPDIDMVYENQDYLGNSDFVSFGCANDMLRYSFLLNRETEKEMSYFWYSWFYYSFAVEKEWYANINIQADGIDTADRLVAVWDKRENLYLMSEEYYLKRMK